MDLNYLSALELEPWQINSGVTPQRGLTPWEPLKTAVATCTACPLHQTRTQTVFGVGNPQAEIMFIGEAPGFYEDQKGEPFVGRGGQLLTAMIKSIGFARDQVYIANILKCRPPNNRDPAQNEVETCTPFLDKQIALIQPRLLVAVGRISAHYLLKTKNSLETLRNKIHYYGVMKTPLIVTYHPAYLLRNPADKKKAYLDLQFILKAIGEINGMFPQCTTQALQSGTS